VIWRTVHQVKPAKLGSMRVLVVDNYDSFVYNLVQYLAQLGADCTVWRNDVVDLEKIAEFDGVLVSPGPGTPESAGQSIDVVKRCAAENVSMLGVCLGHQALGVAFGATVDRAPELLHGKTSKVHHAGLGVLSGLPPEFTATRYHSLTVLPDTIPAEFEVTGLTETGVVMGMRHRELPLEGVQFHPESVLTEGGHRMLANWMAGAGHPVADVVVRELERATQTLQKAAAA
jgi:para-aminobenzoate synthetase component 2